MNFAGTIVESSKWWRKHEAMEEGGDALSFSPSTLFVKGHTTEHVTFTVSGKCRRRNSSAPISLWKYVTALHD